MYRCGYVLLVPAYEGIDKDSMPGNAYQKLTTGFQAEYAGR